MNDLQHRLALLSLDQRWRLLQRIARFHPEMMERYMDSVTPLEDAGRGWRVTPGGENAEPA